MTFLESTWRQKTNAVGGRWHPSPSCAPTVPAGDEPLGHAAPFLCSWAPAGVYRVLSHPLPRFEIATLCTVGLGGGGVSHQTHWVLLVPWGRVHIFTSCIVRSLDCNLEGTR